MRIFLLLAAVLFVAACDSDQPTPTSPSTTELPDTASRVIAFRIVTSASGLPFALDAPLTNTFGVSYRTSMLRYYVSQPAVFDSLGHSTPVWLVDAAGNQLPYNLTLVDAEKPGSEVIRLRLPHGTHAGLAFSIGVPLLGPDGDTLNHSDASTHDYPLNVDADMYWGWKPGYVHFKVEGKADSGSTSLPFYYHVGEDRRLTSITLTGSIVATKEGPSERTIGFDLNNLFVGFGGRPSPNIIGSTFERIANNGPVADTVAMNLANSGLFTLKP